MWLFLVSLIISNLINGNCYNISPSSTVSIPLIPLGESCQRFMIFNGELKNGQVLSQAFMSLDIIGGCV